MCVCSIFKRQTSSSRHVRASCQHNLYLLSMLFSAGCSQPPLMMTLSLHMLDQLSWCVSVCALRCAHQCVPLLASCGFVGLVDLSAHHLRTLLVSVGTCMYLSCRLSSCRIAVGLGRPTGCHTGSSGCHLCTCHCHPSFDPFHASLCCWLLLCGGHCYHLIRVGLQAAAVF